MLKQRYLATNLIFINIHHTKDVVDKYIKKLDKIFSKIKKFENGLNVDKYLEGPACKPGFKRSN